MSRFFVVIFCLSLASCQYFETEKISSETFFEEDIATVNWNEVDQYPLFTNCEAGAEKEEQIACFQSVIVNAITSELSNEDKRSTRDIRDTIRLHLAIDREGTIGIREVRLDTLIYSHIPHIIRKIETGIEKLPKIEPAHKRGIPVATEMVLPVILRTREL